VSIAFRSGNFAQVVSREARRLREHGARDQDVTVVRKSSNQPPRCILHRSHSLAQFRESQALRLIQKRFEHGVEDFDVCFIERWSARKEQVGYGPKSLMPFLRVGMLQRVFNFVKRQFRHACGPAAVTGN